MTRKAVSDTSSVKTMRTLDDEATSDYRTLSVIDVYIREQVLSVITSRRMARIGSRESPRGDPLESRFI